MPVSRELAAMLPEGLDRTLDALCSKLSKRTPALCRSLDYYEGRHPLVYSSAKFRKEFGNLFGDFRDNFCDLVVDSVAERLTVNGFRFSTDEPGTDKDAWEVWQRSGLDAWSPMAHVEALTTAVSYATVWGDADDKPIVTIESSLQMVTMTSEERRGEVVAALKAWVDDDEHGYATLYTRYNAWKFETESTVYDSGTQGAWLQGATWKRRTSNLDPLEPWPVSHPLGVVPVVPIVNRPYLMPRRKEGGIEGRSEIQNAIPLQNMLNTLCLQMFVSAEFAAFKQRWATGIDVPVDPTTNQPVEPFKAAVDRLWVSEEIDAKFGEFSATDLSNYTNAADMIVQHMATQTRTPPHYFFLGGHYPSGDAITSAETGLVAKTTNRSLFFGEAWERVMTLCFKVMGDARGDSIDAETVWAEMEHRTAAEQADSALKRKSVGVPNRQLWVDLGYSEQTISQFEAMLMDQALTDIMSGVASTPPPPAPVNPADTGQPPPPPANGRRMPMRPPQ